MLEQELQLATRIALRGGGMIQEALSSQEETRFRWTTAVHTEVKTQIDKDIDDMQRTEIQRFFPDDAILSEENEFRRGTSGRVWVNDPIDGTLNLQGPLFGTLGVCIALAVNSIPVLGVIFSPDLKTGLQGGGRIWIGQTGKPTLYSPDYPSVEPVEVHVSDCHIRNQAIGACDNGKHHRTAHIPYLEKLFADDGVTCPYNIGSTSMSLCAVAIGGRREGWDFYVATSLHPEDMAATFPIIIGAGGAVTTLDGRAWTIAEPSILAANPVLHEDLLAYLNS